jgi:hypothetical protein
MRLPNLIACQDVIDGWYGVMTEMTYLRMWLELLNKITKNINLSRHPRSKGRERNLALKRRTDMFANDVEFLFFHMRCLWITAGLISALRVYEIVHFGREMLISLFYIIS